MSITVCILQQKLNKKVDTYSVLDHRNTSKYLLQYISQKILFLIKVPANSNSKFACENLNIFSFKGLIQKYKNNKRKVSLFIKIHKNVIWKSCVPLHLAPSLNSKQLFQRTFLCISRIKDSLLLGSYFWISLPYKRRYLNFCKWILSVNTCRNFY